jgi:hypothetical protein
MSSLDEAICCVGMSVGLVLVELEGVFPHGRSIDRSIFFDVDVVDVFQVGLRWYKKVHRSTTYLAFSLNASLSSRTNVAPV